MKKIAIPTLIMAILAAGCQSAAVTSTAIQTALPSDTPTLALATEVPPEPTDVVSEELQEEIAIIINIQAFLKGEGEFSDSSLSEKLFLVYDPYSTKGWVDDDLGLVSCVEDSAFYVQGIPLGVLTDDGYAYMVFGTKNENGDRIVTPMRFSLAIPHFIPLVIAEFQQRHIFWGTFDYEGGTSIIADRDEAITRLKEMIGKPVALQIFFSEEVDRAVLTRRVLAEGGNSEDVERYVIFREENTEPGKAFLTMVRKSSRACVDAVWDHFPAYSGPLISDSSNVNLGILKDEKKSPLAQFVVTMGYW